MTSPLPLAQGLRKQVGERLLLLEIRVNLGLTSRDEQLGRSGLVSSLLTWAWFKPLERIP
jgi:hypothetical protein